MVVAVEVVEGLRNHAGSHRDLVFEEGYADSWGELETAEAQLEDAAAIADSLEGRGYAEELEVVFRRLADRVWTLRNETPDPDDGVPGIDGADASYVLDVTRGGVYHSSEWGTRVPRGRGTGEAFHDRDLAIAARDHPVEMPLWTAAGPFASVPSWLEWDELGYVLGADAEDVLAEKRRAIDAVETVLETYPAEPLAARLCWWPLFKIQTADRSLRRLADDPRSYDDREWATKRDRAFLAYESARRYADAVPETLEFVVG